MKFSNLFSIAIDDYRRGLDIINYDDEITSGSSLRFWSRFLQSEKDMLLQRTGLLIEYEKSNRNLDKAKPNKKEAVSESISYTQLLCQFPFVLDYLEIVILPPKMVKK